MAISMTGFGAAESHFGEWSCQVEIRSVNQRFLDIRCKLPLGLQKLESEIKKEIRLICSRGKIDCFIRLEKSDDFGELRLNFDKAKRYGDLLRDFEDISGKSVIVDARSLVSINIIEETNNSDHPEKCEKVIKKTLSKALDNLKNMKLVEGAVMKKDILKRLSLCGSIIKSVEKLSKVEPYNLRRRLQERLSDLGDDIKINSDRLEQEIVFFAEKIDISEELLRFVTHLSHMDEIMSQNEIGKKAEFLVQELNREVNTISSKSNHAEISQSTVEIKSELEKIREQLQNIE